MAFNKIAEAFVVIKVDKGKFTAGIRGAKRETAGFSRSATKNIGNVTKSLRRLATVAGALAAVAIGVKLTKAVINLGKAAVQAAVKYDQLKIGLAAVAGGAEEAERQLRRLEEVSKLPGLSFKGAIAGSTALQAAGLSAQLSERSLLAFGNALVTVGKGAEDLQGVNLALSQIATGTQGFGQEIRQLQQRLPQVRVAMQDAFGTASAENFKELGISGEQFIEGIVTEFEKLPKVSGTVANALENLGIAFDRLKDEIGKTMLSATEDAAQSMTEIVDGLRLIVANYKEFPIQASEAFREVAIIGITLTGQMVGGIASIMSKLAKIAWVPLKFEMLKVMQDVNDSVEIGIIKMMGTIREFFGGSAEIARLQKETVRTSRIEWDMLFKTIQQTDIDTAIRAGIDGIVTDFDKMFVQFMASMSGMKKATDDFGKNIPKAAAAGETAIEKMARLLAKLRETRGGGREFALIPTEDPAKAEARLKESRQRIIKFREELDRDMQERQGRELENFLTFLDERQQRAEDIASAIAPAFENMFQGLFSGNTKNLWQQFFADLKRIALRELAAVFAFQIAGALIPGFGTAAGIGSALSALAPSSVDPTTRAIGGRVARGVRAVGSFLEGGTVNIFDQNLDTFDKQRMTKRVERDLGPAFAEAAINGITS